MVFGFLTRAEVSVPDPTSDTYGEPGGFLFDLPPSRSLKSPAFSFRPEGVVEPEGGCTTDLPASSAACFSRSALASSSSSSSSD